MFQKYVHGYSATDCNRSDHIYLEKGLILIEVKSAGEKCEMASATCPASYRTDISAFLHLRDFRMTMVFSNIFCHHFENSNLPLTYL